LRDRPSEAVGLDVRVREQVLHNLDVTVLRRDVQRRGPVRRAFVDLDALAWRASRSRTTST
jgi:hypothetical protein